MSTTANALLLPTPAGLVPLDLLPGRRHSAEFSSEPFHTFIVPTLWPDVTTRPILGPSAPPDSPQPSS